MSLSKTRLVNYYDRLGDFARSEYYNPNKFAPQHPARMIFCGPSGSSKTNTALNFVDKMGNFQKIYLVGANARTEPLYKFLKHKLGDQLKVLDDIYDLPPLKSDTKMASDREKPVKGGGRSKGRKLKGKGTTRKSGESSESESSSSEDESEDEKSDGSDSDQDEPSGIHDKTGKTQKLVIFEDCVFDGPKTLRIINSWFTRSRNMNYSVMLTTQSWFNVPKSVRLNANYCVFFRTGNVREVKNLVKDFGLEMTPEKLLEAFRLATHKPGDFLMIDLQNPDPTKRIRHNFADVIQ